MVDLQVDPLYAVMRADGALNLLINQSLDLMRSRFLEAMKQLDGAHDLPPDYPLEQVRIASNPE